MIGLFYTNIQRPDSVRYRYGFNGKERDPEGLGGGGSTYDYGFRIYNPSLGRFLSIDPLNHNYPFYSPYLYAGNKPIIALDLDGLEELDYKLYAEHMKQGATKLNKVKFRGANPHITNNEYWGTEANGGRLVMKEGKNPAAALNHIFSQPDNYKFGCAEYIQVVMLYGKLKAMGDKKFNEFIKGVDNGKFGIDSYGATGNKVDSQWYINDDGAWVNTKKAWKFKTAKKRSKYREKGERRFNPEKHALNMPIGTKVYLDNMLLGDNHSYDGENMLKVGEDLYIAQFLGDGLLTMDEAKKELAKRSLIAQLAKDLEVKESELTEKQKEDYFKDNLTEDYIEKTVKISSFEEYKTTEKK